MDMWKYFFITHADHLLMNPMSATKLQEMIELFRLSEKENILDIACGKAEYLCMVAKRYSVSGTGIDASPLTAKEAKENVEAKGMAKSIEILNMDGANYKPKEPESFCVSSCIGGSWIYGGYRGTLEALSKMTKPGGLVLVGEPFWKAKPAPEYIEMTGYVPEHYGTHFENVKAGEELNLTFLHSIVSNKDDWDRYEGLQWQAAERYAYDRADDPDNEQMLERVHRERDAYLLWGRKCLGWAIYLFRK